MRALGNHELLEGSLLASDANIIFEDVPMDEDTLFNMPIEEVQDISWFDYLSKHIALGILTTSKQSKAYNQYLQYYKYCLNALRDSLERYFPDRWDIQLLRSMERMESTLVSHFQTHNNFEEGIRNYLDGQSELVFNRVLIFFPEINITNSRGQRSVMKELYVILELDYRCAVVGTMKCFRTSKTVREHASHYNHSHARKSNNAAVTFCLGATSLETLVAGLRTDAFNQLNYELLFQQLPDYLAWESLEGGPHISISELLKAQDISSSPPTLNSSSYTSILKSMAKHNVPVSLVETVREGRIEKIEAVRNMELWRAITQFIPPGYLFPQRDGTFNSVYPAIGTRSDADIRRGNAEVAYSDLVYKGNRLRLQVELQKKEEKETGEVELLADQRILEYAIYEIGLKLTKHVNDVYWYGIECSKKSNTPKI